MRKILTALTVTTGLAGATAFAYAQESATPPSGDGQTMNQNGMMGGSMMGDGAMMQDGMKGMMPMMDMMAKMAPMMDACTRMMSAMADDMEQAPETGSNG